MAVYYVNRNLTPDQSDQWPMSFPPLPPSDYDRFLGWSMMGVGLASSEPVPPQQNAQLQCADVSSTETYSLDVTKDFWYPSGYPNAIGTTGYHTPGPFSDPQPTIYPEHEQRGINNGTPSTTYQHPRTDTPQQSMRKPKRPSLSPKSHPEPRMATPIRPKPMPKRRSSQDSTASQRRRSTSSDNKDDDPNICMLRKKAHNQVEKRYRANLNAGFKQLEDVTKQDATTAATDTKMAKGLRPGRKALILQHAYEHIVCLQAELRSLQKRLGER
ncbi:Helix-loop-helix DNA-binding domain protein [Aspergillus parasiticus SU-1]|uniref:Helix-loop-helix DNA-binding domain protein n=1 Tax=Aspergillus parasiticus (strain ATCC 56775 / NRRL 5862 / SRRC 143 / SU-1) TaxID=1403190 RepID=A0A0F0IDI9_ASPPU|nr:Helix-loop-helix DNA-binding domain protein [Aspergillus parasiticus SU-1]